MMSDTKVKAFIVGMSRSGTTALSRALNNHPSLSVIGETTFWGRNFVDNYSDLTWQDFERLLEKTAARLLYEENYNRLLKNDIRERLKKAWGKDLLKCPKNVFDIYCETVLEHENKNFIIEKAPHHVHFYSRLKKYYPEAKFIVLQRNPYDFMLSYKHQGDRKPEPARKMFNKLYHPIGTSFVLKKYLKSISELNVAYPNDSKIFTLTELKKDSKKVLSEIYHFLELEEPSENNVQKRNSSFNKNKKPELEPADIFWINKIAGSKVEENGFVKRDVNIRFSQILKSAFSIPYWVYFVVKRILAQSNDWKSYIRRMLF